MMKRLPQWSLWAGLSVVLWLVWAAWLHGSLSHGLDTLRETRDSAQKKRNELQAKVTMVPTLVARLDSSRSALQTAIGQYHSVEELDDLMKDLKTSARLAGIINAEAGPDLESVLELDTRTVSASTTEFHADTLLVAISTINDFRRIGRWLNTIEARADFQHWVECRWERAGEDDLVRFDGLVALLVTAASDAPIMNAGVDDGHE